MEKQGGFRGFVESRLKKTGSIASRELGSFENPGKS